VNIIQKTNPPNAPIKAPHSTPGPARLIPNANADIMEKRAIDWSSERFHLAPTSRSRAIA